MVKLFLKNFILCDHNSPTSQTDRRTDRQTTCDRNTALCTKVHRAVKTVEVRIMKFLPYGSAIPLVFASKFHPEILSGSRAGTSNKGGESKISSLLSSSVKISKMVADTAKVTMTNRRSHMGFSLTPRSMTLDDPELL